MLALHQVPRHVYLDWILYKFLQSSSPRIRTYACELSIDCMQAAQPWLDLVTAYLLVSIYQVQKYKLVYINCMLLDLVYSH